MRELQAEHPGQVVMRRVWVDSWQMQCCGAPFEVGSDVSWTAVPTMDTSWFATFLTEAEAAAITHHEEHHSEQQEHVPTIAGVVRSIDAVYCRYRLSGRAAVPVAESGRLVRRTSADGWEPEGSDEAYEEPRFVGYLIDLFTE